MIQESITIDIHTSSKNFLEIENCIHNIKVNSFPQLECNKMAKLLSEEFKPVTIEKINLVEAKDKAFFGSRVFPSKSHLEEIIEENIMERKANIILERCVLELDSKIFFEMDLSERQIMAIILHEMGHILSDRKLIKPRSLLASCCVLPLCLITPQSFILSSLLLTGLASYYIYGLGKNIYLHRTEIEADSLAVSCGYGKELAESLEHAKRYIQNDKVSSLEFAKADLKWGMQSLTNFEKRRNIIYRELEKKRKENNSPYMQEIIDKQLSDVKIKSSQAKKRQKAGIISVSVNKLEEACDIYLESLSFNRNPEREADLISMEIGRIETTEDKLYLTKKIHKNIVLCQASIEKISKRDPNDPRIPLLKANIEKLKNLVPEIKKVKTEINPFIIKIAYPYGDYEDTDY